MAQHPPRACVTFGALRPDRRRGMLSTRQNFRIQAARVSGLHTCLFAGGTEGAHAMAMLLGLAVAVRELGLDRMAYFTWAIERRGTHAAR